MSGALETLDPDGLDPDGLVFDPEALAPDRIVRRFDRQYGLLQKAAEAARPEPEEDEDGAMA